MLRVPLPSSRLGDALLQMARTIMMIEHHASLVRVPAGDLHCLGRSQSASSWPKVEPGGRFADLPRYRRTDVCFVVALVQADVWPPQKQIRRSLLTSLSEGVCVEVSGLTSEEEEIGSSVRYM